GAEFVAQHPRCVDVLVGVALLPAAENRPAVEVPTLTARCTRALAPADAQRAQAWLAARTKTAGARLVLVPAERRR
ncbi:hypothetical protein, partial [Massilia alkalitolerans]|uniref:hypothetical protein n=1 Tax=Massilia alkalitolerans TaxID=286638 RepID=UPI0028B18C6D